MLPPEYRPEPEYNNGITARPQQAAPTDWEIGHIFIIFAIPAKFPFSHLRPPQPCCSSWWPSWPRSSFSLYSTSLLQTASSISVLHPPSLSCILYLYQPSFILHLYPLSSILHPPFPILLYTENMCRWRNVRDFISDWTWKVKTSNILFYIDIENPWCNIWSAE